MPLRAWGGVEFGMVGDVETVAKIGLASVRLPAIAFEEQRKIAVIELEEARKVAPFDTDPPAGESGGELRESGRTIDVEDGDMVGVAIAFGGVVDAPHAIRQHQGHYEHPEGEREYLIATLDAGRPYYGKRLVAGIERRVGEIR